MAFRLGATLGWGRVTNACPIEPECGAKVLVCKTGSLDHGCAAGLREQLCHLLRSCHCLVIDLQSAAPASSDTLGELLALAEELEQSGKELRLVIRAGSAVEESLRCLGSRSNVRFFHRLDSAWAAPRPDEDPVQ